MYYKITGGIGSPQRATGCRRDFHCVSFRSPVLYPHSIFSISLIMMLTIPAEKSRKKPFQRERIAIVVQAIGVNTKYEVQRVFRETYEYIQ